MTVESATPSTSTERRLGLTDRLQPVLLLGAIGVGLGIGRAAPGLAGLASNTVSIGVFILIALVMLNVNPRNVASVYRRTRFLTAAIVLNFVVNPIIAWVLGSVFLAHEPDLRVGLLLFLVTPCIGWYLIFTELAGGDAELGVGLLGINVILQIALLPVYLAVFIGDTAGLDVATILRSVAIYLVLPALFAAAVRQWWSHLGRIAAEEQQRLRVSMLKTAAALGATSMSPELVKVKRLPKKVV